MSTPDTAKENLILALDVDNTDRARAVVSELRGSVGMFKMGLQLFTAAGPAFVRELTSEGLLIFLDLKFHDIPQTVASAGVEAARLGVFMFNIHAAGGDEMMRRTAGEVADVTAREGLQPTKIIAVTVLTSIDQAAMNRAGTPGAPAAQVLRLAKLAKEAGLDGVVASPKEASAIRAQAGRDFLIVTPGVRPADAANDDQSRISTPAAAIAAGADYLVVGRPILRAQNPSAAAERIVEEIKTALDEATDHHTAGTGSFA
jgi:orotidine-5'-phosphate decarboxylase